MISTDFAEKQTEHNGVYAGTEFLPTIEHRSIKYNMYK